MTSQNIPLQAIRERSYQIWLNEGKPEGKSTEHWLRAEAELECEINRSLDVSQSGLAAAARPTISRPPKRKTSKKVAEDKAGASIST